MGNLTNWSAFVGKNGASSTKSPQTTTGVSTISEYQLSIPGIQVITSPGTDFFGGFPTIPVINGYDYKYSVLLGSTSVSQNGNGGGQGGYIRGISYLINVPTSSIVEPYTMTYAYAMVLENGTHNSSQQPLISATLTSQAGVITCASPSYFLPTFGNTSGNGTSGATLDTATAEQNGFHLSPQLSPNLNRGGNGGVQGYLQDVWTKSWTEVTFDLSPYRGQQVTLTFEADNCVPGGHFAYGYIALRNTCAGLAISGSPNACTNSEITYSIPSLAGGTYAWEVPAGWSVISGLNDYIIKVKPGNQGGQIIAHEINGCADLRDTLDVVTSLPTVPGNLTGDNNVCSGLNNSPILLRGYTGNILRWIATSDGVSWRDLAVVTPAYNAQNLATTTTYKAIVQNGPSCSIDTSTAVIVKVDPKSVGGAISPALTNICIGQDRGAILTVTGSTGNVINWQLSQDEVSWSPFNPPHASTVYSVSGINVPTRYRTIVQSGVCPPDTSALARVNMINAAFPEAVIRPADTVICYGTSAQLEALISIGTNYKWTNLSTLSSVGNGIVASNPAKTTAVASPLTTTQYILQIENAGCPNVLTDTFNVIVREPVLVNAGNDTAVVIGQSLQLQATVSGTSGDDQYKWTPSTGLNNTNVSNPVAFISSSMQSTTYFVTVTSSDGCTGKDDVYVRIFKTAPDVFVPNAFTPGKGTNNIFRPVPAGIAVLRYFKVFNRWGQLVYNTSVVGAGWNGVYNGKVQESGSYVWMLEATTYDGRTINRKGPMVLVR